MIAGSMFITCYIIFLFVLWQQNTTGNINSVNFITRTMNKILSRIFEINLFIVIFRKNKNK